MIIYKYIFNYISCIGLTYANWKQNPGHGGKLILVIDAIAKLVMHY